MRQNLSGGKSEKFYLRRDLSHLLDKFPFPQLKGGVQCLLAFLFS